MELSELDLWRPWGDRMPVDAHFRIGHQGIPPLAPPTAGAKALLLWPDDTSNQGGPSVPDAADVSTRPRHVIAYGAVC